MDGQFITFEGGEGAGKSTQIKSLSRYLEGFGKTVRLTREPGGSAGAEEVRKLLVEGEVDRWDPLSETLLLMAARRSHLTNLIEPALAAGEWVLCDRFSDSTIAYQGYGQGLAQDVIRELDAIAVGSVRPSLTFLLDIEVEKGLARARARGGDAARYERMDIELHERVRAGFRALAAQAPERMVLIDADQPLEAVESEIRNCIARRFGLK